MWLTQTYLSEPGNTFSIYSYFLFNPYTDWNSNSLRSIKDGRRVLGRETENRMSILFPDEATDVERIGQQLNLRFEDFIKKKIKLGTKTKCGLLLLDIPLNQLSSDGTGANWVYSSFDEFIEPGGVTQDYFSMMQALANCSSENQLSPNTNVRPMSSFLSAFENISTKRSRKRGAEIPSLSSSGLSFNISKLISFFKSDSGIKTNMYT